MDRMQTAVGRNEERVAVSHRVGVAQQEPRLPRTHNPGLESGLSCGSAGTSPSRSQRGFSLTEVLVATAIFAIIFVAALMIYDRSNKVFKQGVESSDSQQNTRVAFDTMVSDLRMAGFDHDRDGIPTGSSSGVAQEQQPDEQIEYIGRAAVTIRGNFDFETAASDDQGRETNLESTQFPVVTTGNDEIVTYALRSEDASKNTDSISFFADISVPRDAYPGGSAEEQVTIPEVDLSNQNPPYTLFRFTLNDSGEPVEQPLADNIRSLTFTYFEDSSGQKLLTNVVGTTELDQTKMDSVVGGKGQFSPANPSATVDGRVIRSKVRSVRLEVVGMNEAPDGGYTDPEETIAAVENYRKYRLESIVVPRNFGKRGMKEQSVKPPGQPTLNDVCFGLCGMALLQWTPHPETGVYGGAEQFELLADVNNAGTWARKQGPESGTTGWMSALDPTTTYYYAIRAINGYGSADSTTPYDSGKPQNNTTLESPSDLVATAGGEAVPGGIQVNWNAPAGYVSGKDTLTCSSGAVKPAPLQMAEISGYRVWRSKDENFTVTPTSSTDLAYTESSPEVIIDNATKSASIFDKSVAPCKSFYYRVMAVKSSCTAAGANGTNGSAYSAILPPSGSPAIEGYADSTGNPPKAPINLAVDTAASVPGSPQHKVVLNWPSVSFDTAGNPVGVDDYVVKRYRKKAADPDFYEDPKWDYSSPHVTDGLDQGNQITYTDDTAWYADMVDDPDDVDPLDTGKGELWEYKYTVMAQTCSDQSVESVGAEYPPPCTFSGSPVVQAGATSGDGSAGNPWVMDAGDAISVYAPATEILTRVVFDVFDSTGSSIETLVDEDATDGFLYVWKDLVDNELYRVLITITNDTGCIEQKDRFILDQAVSPCTVSPATIVEGPEVVGQAQDRFKDYTIQIDNTSTSDNLNPYAIKFTWADAGNADAWLESIKWPGATDTAFSQTTPGTITESTPAGTLSVTPDNTAYAIAIRIGYKANKGTGTVTNAVSNVCFAYTISAEPGVIKYCSIVGSTAGNPDSCF